MDSRRRLTEYRLLGKGGVVGSTNDHSQHLRRGYYVPGRALTTSRCCHSTRTPPESEARGLYYLSTSWTQRQTTGDLHLSGVTLRLLAWVSSRAFWGDRGG